MKKQNIKISIFNNVKLIIFVGNIEEIVKFTKDYNLSFDSERFNGGFYEEDNIIVIKEDKFSLGTLMHELYHFVSFIYKDYGIPMSYENDEIGAYIMKYCIDEIEKKKILL